jgi:hypothetical protein
MPFLNQVPVAESNRAGRMHDPATYAEKESALVEPKKRIYQSHRTEEAINAKSSLTKVRPEVSRDASSHSAHFTSARQEQRPNSPRRRNVEKLKSHHDDTSAVPAQTSPPGPKILENLPSIRTIPSSPHKRQGPTLNTHDAESATTPRQRQITDRTQSGSSHAASPNTQSRVLSTLTGLSAGSLARRRLLRKIARADERAAKEDVSPADLEEELRIFKQQHQSQGSQAFGPTAKYGSAKVPNANVRSAPEIPQASPRQRTQSAHASTARAFFQSPTQNQDRSPDWFAGTGSPAYSMLHRNCPSHTSPGNTVPRANTSRLGLGLTDAPFCQTMDRTNAVTQSPYGRMPGNARSTRGAGQAFPHYSSPRPVYVEEQLLHYGGAEDWPTENDTRSYVDGWQYAPTPEDRISYPDERHQYQNARLPEPSTSTVSYPAEPPYRAPTPRLASYIPAAAPFQQGRAGLYSYHDTSSPACPSMQPPRGFWQRNVL